jgi:hypothetical protein
MDNSVSAYSLLQKLESSKSNVEKVRFSKHLMTLLQQKKAPVDFIIKSVIEQSLGTYSFIRDLWAKGTFEVSYRPYIDSDELLKLAFGISYMPDHREYKLEDDIKLTKHVLRIINKRNLDLIVNDVTVNFLQIRNNDSSKL